MSLILETSDIQVGRPSVLNQDLGTTQSGKLGKVNLNLYRHKLYIFIFSCLNKNKDPRNICRLLLCHFSSVLSALLSNLQAWPTSSNATHLNSLIPGSLKCIALNRDWNEARLLNYFHHPLWKQWFILLDCYIYCIPYCWALADDLRLLFGSKMRVFLDLNSEYS